MIPKVEVRLGGPSDFADYLQIKSSLEDIGWDLINHLNLKS